MFRFFFIAERGQSGRSAAEEQPGAQTSGLLQAGPGGETAPIVNGRRQCVRFFFMRGLLWYTIMFIPKTEKNWVHKGKFFLGEGTKLFYSYKLKFY